MIARILIQLLLPSRTHWFGFATLTVLTISGTLSARDVIWDRGGFSSEWSTSLNWNPNVVPSQTDDVLIENASSVIKRDFLNIRDGGSLIVNKSNLEVLPQSGSGFLRVGTSGTAALEITSVNDLTDDPGTCTSTSSTVTINQRILTGTDLGSVGVIRVRCANSLLDGGEDLTVGDDGDGTLIILEGAEVVNDGSARIANKVGITGIASLSGSNSIWRIGDFLYLGDEGIGTLQIVNGAEVETDGETSIGKQVTGVGVAIIDGTTSTLDVADTIFVGDFGIGTLVVSGGGQVFNGVSRDTIIGRRSSRAVGTVRVSGASSLLESRRDIIVGDMGEGTLNVANEGNVVAGDDVTIGLGSGTGQVTVDGPGSTLTVGSSVGNDLSVGGLGTGSLSVSNGGAVSVAGKLLVNAQSHVELRGGDITAQNLDSDGRFDFLAGELTLTGSGLHNLAETFSIPSGGRLNAQGTIATPIAAQGGSMIIANGNLTLGDAASLVGFVGDGEIYVGRNTVTLRDMDDVALGTLTKLGEAIGPGTVEAANGAVADFADNITGFGTVVTPDDPLRPTIINGHVRGDSAARKITFTGFVKGVGTFDNVAFSGTFVPGLSPTALNLGSATYNGTVVIELGGTTPGIEHDQLNHLSGAGTANLGGTLDLRMINGYGDPLTRGADDEFTIITAITRMTTFTSVVYDGVSLVSEFANGESFRDHVGNGTFRSVNYSNTAVEFRNLFARRGDADGDKDVDITDFNNLVQNFDPTGINTATNDWVTADFDMDGDVDITDFNALVTNFAPTGYGTRVVPEPASPLLWMLGAAIGILTYEPRGQKGR